MKGNNMIKIALVVTIISISNPEKVPEITIPVYYKDFEQCNEQLDFLKKTVNAEELLDSKNNRMIRMHNREYHHQSFIFWSCISTEEKIHAN